VINAFRDSMQTRLDAYTTTANEDEINIQIFGYRYINYNDVITILIVILFLLFNFNSFIHSFFRENINNNNNNNKMEQSNNMNTNTHLIKYWGPIKTAAIILRAREKRLIESILPYLDTYEEMVINYCI
jgi:hypothetical protein